MCVCVCKRHRGYALTLEALVLLANQVLNRHLDVLKGNVRRARRPHALAIHPPRADAAHVALDEQQAHAAHAGLARPHRDGEVVAPDAVGDPLLLAVDNVVLAVLAQLRLAPKVRDVAARVGLSDGQADPLVAVQDTGKDAVNKGLLAELDQRGETDAQAANDVPHEAAGAGARELVGEEHLVEEVPLLGRDGRHAVLGVGGGVVHAQQAGEVAAAAHLLVDRRGDLLGLVPLGDVGLDVVLDPLADLGAEGGVALVEVGGVVLAEC